MCGRSYRRGIRESLFILNLSRDLKLSDRIRQEGAHISATTACLWGCHLLLQYDTDMAVNNFVGFRSRFSEIGVLLRWGADVNGLPSCLRWGGLVSAAVGVNDSSSLLWTHVPIKGGSGSAENDLIWLCPSWEMTAPPCRSPRKRSWVLFLQP